MTNIALRDADGFYRFKNKKKYISVNTLFKKVLGLPEGLVEHYFCKFGWEEANRRSKIAADIGTKTHDALYQYYFKDMPPSDLIKNRVKFIDQKFIELNVTPLFGEKSLYLDGLDVAGTFDFCGLMDRNDIIVIDWKTGRENPEKELMQVAMYSTFIEVNQVNLKIPRKFTSKNIYVLLVYVGKHDTCVPVFRLYTPEWVLKGRMAFRNLVEYYKYTETIKEKTNESSLKI